ncbi:hypothetical protein HQ489_04115 [Candidatus Woesearchaeota archaeon]|nr:hypothetical protein [Candidatus Woesearchaeota archaeon]
MDVCIKNINEENWRYFKSESSKHNVTMGELFNKIVGEHKESCNNSNIKEILFGEKTLKGFVTRDEFKKNREFFRKNFRMKQ